MKKPFIGMTLTAITLTGITLWSAGLNQAAPYSLSPASHRAINKQESTIEGTPVSKEQSGPKAAIQGDPVATKMSGAVAQVIEDAEWLVLKKNLKIVAVGDSLTEGIGDTTKKGGYVGIIKNTLENNRNHVDVKVENFGKIGTRSDQLIQKLEQKQIISSIKHADVILITIGANDVMKIVRSNFAHLTYEEFVREYADYKTRLEKVMSLLKAKNNHASIYLIGIYNPFDTYFGDIKEMNQVIADWNNISSSVAGKYHHAVFIPIADLFQHPKEDLLYEDNFHPNEKGYKLMAERVLQYIRPAIEKRGQ